MTIGLIFECGPEGADRKVCEYLAKRVMPGIEVESVTLDTKKKLISGCGRAAATLLETGCERVVIVWDLYPSWQRNTVPCRKEDREAIMQALSATNVDMTRIFLVCIEAELEAWLLADNRALAKFLSTPERQIRVDKVKNPERIINPKARLNSIFKKQARRRYEELFHPIKIVEALPDLDRIKRVGTFARFALKIADIEL